MRIGLFRREVAESKIFSDSEPKKKGVANRKTRRFTAPEHQYITTRRIHSLFVDIFERKEYEVCLKNPGKLFSGPRGLFT